ncbi:PREDICTED: uncharacterized protein LOC106817075, partial [Priapulus caudatus]|uniref:Uncharacterized protein LOC106817075 n=1 Tax=Priapulus caudatus TaxID=37621 RepID=A0ABM1EYD7_PRICU
AAKQARFTELFYRTYRYLNDSAGYYNGGELPTKQILLRNRDLVHRENKKLGVHTSFIYYVFMKRIEWKPFYAIHLFYNQRRDNIDDAIDEYTAENIKTLNTTFGEMARWIYYGTTDVILDG